MSKLKFLLLWWIFTLVWIFNFSSAYNLTENINFQWWLYESQNYYFPSSTYWQNIYVTCSWQGNLKLFFSCRQKYFAQWSETLNKKITEWCYIQSTAGNTASTCSYSYNSSVLPFNQLFLLLNPAWESLKNSFYVIIPYVVYIWIWILVCTLWFICIRRLVNWLWRKINSVFSSKRW